MRATGRLMAAVLPVLAILAVAPNLQVLTVGWIVAIGTATFLTWRQGRPNRAVRQAAWHAILIPLLPALAVVAGLDPAWFAIDITSAVVLVAAGLPIAALAERRGRDGVIVASAAVVAVRAFVAAGGPWPLQLAAAVVTFGLLSSGWRVAAIVDMRRRRMRSRRRALGTWRAIDARGFDAAANAGGHLFEAWSVLVGRVVPISLALEARLVFGGLVAVVAYLLWVY